MDLISKIQNFHYSKLRFTLLTVVLAPISFLYFIFISIKNFFYEIGVLKSEKADIKVICIGNLTTGGVGKTPVVIEVANYLASKEEKPAIITRGYKGKLSQKKPSIIRNFNEILIDDPELSGDEPNLISKSVEGVAVLVGSDRFELAKCAKELGATVVIMDDGFTNRRLYKDQTIFLFDYEKFIGNGCLLPLGPLREPLNEIKRADKILIINKSSKEIQLDEKLIKKLQYKDILVCDILPNTIKNPKTGETLNPKTKSMAFTGIGSPAQFFNFLENKCQLISTKTFEDHHNYTKEDLEILNNLARENDVTALITTTKDYVKIKNLPSEIEIYVLELKISLNLEGILK